MNPMDIFKNLQGLQSRAREIQEKMKYISVTGSSGGDMVRIKLNGQMDVQSVEISPEAVDPSDIKMLEDLVLAAFTDASYKMKEKIKEEITDLAGDINLHPGFMGV